MSLNPYIKARNNRTPQIMLDVIIALVPLLVVSGIAYGLQALFLFLVAIAAALLTDFVCSLLLLRNRKSVFDGSSVVTALLLTFTLSPITPWYVVATGAAAAILFGKVCWGGLGKNRFNPALVGREIMTAFFPAVLGSAGIWATSSAVNVTARNFFPGLEVGYLDSYLSGLIYKTSGAMGEYSILLIAMGGLYLLARKRISWHIPTALLFVFFAGFWLVDDGASLRYSVAGVLFGAIFMATDMPSSPGNNPAKLFFGGMIGLVTFLLIWGGIRFEYVSYSILILNGFGPVISEVFKPRVWGEKVDWIQKSEKVFFLILAIWGVSFAVLSLARFDFIPYLVFLYMAYLLFKFRVSFSKQIANPI